jgi:hypothetical protein
MKKIFIVIGTLILALTAVAQTPDSIKTELYRINKIFDSSEYLAFDVNIVYNSDTSYGKYEHEEMSGNYVINNHNMYYKMGTTEYMQNDSFSYNVYNNDKMMVMTKNFVEANSTIFPLKNFVDSILTWYDSLYTITLSNDTDSRIIEFTSSLSNLPYNHFAIYYSADSYHPDKFEMSFVEPLNDYPDMPDSVISLIKLRPVTKKITMYFTNYHSAEDENIFNDENYVYYDRMKNEYRPAKRFRSYRFYADGINGEDYDPTVEVASPNGN